MGVTAMFEFCSGARQSEIRTLGEVLARERAEKEKEKTSTLGEALARERAEKEKEKTSRSEIRTLGEALARERAEKEKEKLRADTLRETFSADRILAHSERLQKRDEFAGTRARGKYGFWDDSLNVEDNSFWLKSSDALAGEALEMEATELAKAKKIESKIAAGKLKHLNSPELKDELAAIEGIFAVLDQDKNDTVSKAELLTFFPKNKKMFDSMDYNHDDNISKAEMLLYIDMSYDRDAKKAHGFVAYLKATAEKKQKALDEHGKARFAECQEAKSEK